VCACVCARARVCMCVLGCSFVYEPARVCVCTHVYMYDVRVCTCAYVFLRVCMWVYFGMYVCVRVCAYMYVVRVCTCMCTCAYVCACGCTFVYDCTSVCVYECVRLCTYVNGCTSVSVHVCVRAHLQMCVVRQHDDGNDSDVFVLSIWTLEFGLVIFMSTWPPARLRDAYMRVIAGQAGSHHKGCARLVPTMQAGQDSWIVSAYAACCDNVLVGFGERLKGPLSVLLSIWKRLGRSEG
jgi:hypothetical protein